MLSISLSLQTDPFVFLLDCPLAHVEPYSMHRPFHCVESVLGCTVSQWLWDFLSGFSQWLLFGMTLRPMISLPWITHATMRDPVLSLGWPEHFAQYWTYHLGSRSLTELLLLLRTIVWLYRDLNSEDWRVAPLGCVNITQSVRISAPCVRCPIPHAKLTYSKMLLKLVCMIDCDVFCTVYVFHATRGCYRYDKRYEMIDDVTPSIWMNVLDLISLFSYCGPLSTWQEEQFVYSL